jgi:hypothetical protein
MQLGNFLGRHLVYPNPNPNPDPSIICNLSSSLPSLTYSPTCSRTPNNLNIPVCIYVHGYKCTWIYTHTHTYILYIYILSLFVTQGLRVRLIHFLRLEKGMTTLNQSDTLPPTKV